MFISKVAETFKYFDISISEYVYYASLFGISKPKSKGEIKMVKETSHYVHPTGLAFGLTGGLVYILCAAFVALWPSGALNFFSKWFHGIDLIKISVTPQITVGNFITGLVGIVIAAYLVGAFYAWTYNKCVTHCKQRNWI